MSGWDWSVRAESVEPPEIGSIRIRKQDKSSCRLATRVLTKRSAKHAAGGSPLRASWAKAASGEAVAGSRKPDEKLSRAPANVKRRRVRKGSAAEGTGREADGR